MVTSLLCLQKQSFYKCELKLNLNTTGIKQQGFTWIPQVFLSTQTLPLTLSLCFLSVSVLHVLVSVIQWLLNQLTFVCSFSPSGSSAPDLCPLKSSLSVKQSLLNVFRDGGHLSCNGRDHWRVKNLKTVVLCLHREIHVKHCKIHKNAFYRS